MATRNVPLLAAGCALLALSACASSRDRPPQSRVPGGEAAQAMLERAPVRRPALGQRGEPGIVATADRAFARAAQEVGLWSAYRSFATSDAVLHLPDGVTAAAPWLAGRADPAAAPQWSPTAVWSSCDGSLAVSFGRYADPDGTVGSYAAIWARQDLGRNARDAMPSDAYRFTYKLRGPDNPQPPPPAPRVDAAMAGPDAIVVAAIGVIDGKVADCARGAVPAAPGIDAGGTTGPLTTSDDRTLQWHWVQDTDGTRRLLVDYYREGRWQRALDFVMPPGGARR
ncbi:hypothetical protein [Alteraurantiacibacter palmitatis]|uniref:Lipoprotein n=1 Tax=Alteraurantiacibacter palmitatis TaxID=2054628 RepID=A0ABV7E6H7_9SPHN